MTHSSIPNDIAFTYRGFWIESEPFDQAENGHPEDGITYTSYVYTSMTHLMNSKLVLNELLMPILEARQKKEIKRSLRPSKS